MPIDRAAAPAPPARSSGAPGGSVPEPGDGGYTLIEVLVAIVIIGTVMAAAAPFMVRSLALSSQQRTQQAAIQIVNDGLERVRALDAGSLLSGRGQTEVQAQWDKAPDRVKSLYPFDKVSASDAWVKVTDGISAPLPTRPFPVTLSGLAFNQNFYAGQCFVNKATTTSTSTPALVGSCEAKSGTNSLPFVWVVVSVTWTQSSCPAGGCLVVSSTLVSTAEDVVFNVNTAAPAIVDIAAQGSYVSTLSSIPMASTGGRLPLVWSASNLPAGVTIDAGTGEIKGTPTTAGTYSVVVKVLDRDKRADTSSFKWTVTQPLLVTSPGNQTSRTGTALTLAIATTGGVTPLTWTQTGLPAGLTLNPATGVITGTPTAAATTTTQITVVDSATTPAPQKISFSWQVLTPVTLAALGTQTATIGNVVSYPLQGLAGGGLKPYSWTAANLPAGTAISATTGAVSGLITRASRFVTTVTVTDAAGGTAAIDVVVVVNAAQTSDVRFTAPVPSGNAVDQSTAQNATVAFNPAVQPAGTYSWTATGLPTGLAINASTGAVSGKPTVKGSYKVTLVAKGTLSSATLMFTWTVT